MWEFPERPNLFWITQPYSSGVHELLWLSNFISDCYMTFLGETRSVIHPEKTLATDQGNASTQVQLVERSSLLRLHTGVWVKGYSNMGDSQLVALRSPTPVCVQMESCQVPHPSTSYLSCTLDLLRSCAAVAKLNTARRRGSVAWDLRWGSNDGDEDLMSPPSIWIWRGLCVWSQPFSITRPYYAGW